MLFNLLSADLGYRLQNLSFTDFVNFKMVFLSIVIEAMPFLLFSVIVSAILNNFVSSDLIRRVLPNNPFLSILCACFLGVIFPVCDCGTVPIVRRLVLKKVPLPTAISFMLAAPIINPVVTAATAYAFQNNYTMVYWRLGFAFIVAFSAGLLLSQFVKGSQLKSSSHFHVACGCSFDDPSPETPFSGKIRKTVSDACAEFFEMGKYLLYGAFLGAVTQAIISRSVLLLIGQDSLLSIATMLLLAFCISVRSSADAFIAASFSANFSTGSLLAFMVFGPMLDFKNTLMLLHAFKLRFVMLLLLITVALCAGGAYFINLV